MTVLIFVLALYGCGGKTAAAVAGSAMKPKWYNIIWGKKKKKKNTIYVYVYPLSGGEKKNNKKENKMVKRAVVRAVSYASGLDIIRFEAATAATVAGGPQLAWTTCVQDRRPGAPGL